MSYATTEPLDDVVVAFHLSNSEGEMLMATNTLMLGARTDGFDGPGQVVFRIDQLGLGDGIYPLQIGATYKDDTVLYDHRGDKDVIEVGGADGFIGSVALPMQVTIT